MLFSSASSYNYERRSPFLICYHILMYLFYYELYEILCLICVSTFNWLHCVLINYISNNNFHK